MKKILVVDNHPVIIKYMTDILEKNGHEVVTAQDGLSALERLKSFKPDVIFSDLVMPNIGGDKLCRIIRSMPEFKDIYLIIVSGIAIEEDLDFKSFGADLCIAKGPLNKMSEHVFSVLEQIDHIPKKSMSSKILGLKDLYHREVTEELLSSKKHSEVILKNMTEGILEITRDDKIIYTNPAAVSLINIPEEKLLASNFCELFQPNHQDIVRTLLTNIGDDIEYITEENPVILKDKHVSLTFLPVRDQAHPSIIVILNNIDEKKRLEAQLNMARKMEAIGTLAGGIAHEFNNSLVGVSGNIELLKMDIPEDLNIDEYLSSMITSVRRMARLTKQLLAYARGGKYRSAVVSLSDFAEETIPLIKHKLDPAIRIETDFPPDVYKVEADQTQIQMVLSAIMENSAEAMEGSGRIKIRLRNRIVDKEFTKNRPGLIPDHYACLIVEDDGKGMDEITTRKVFEPFFTTNFQGRGLGLSAAYGIIKNHNGWISIESELGKGTIVSVYLPRNENTCK